MGGVTGPPRRPRPQFRGPRPPNGRYPAGEPLAEDGYSFILSGIGAGVDIELRVAAGCTALAARLPMHTLSIKLRTKASGAITGDALCAAVASSWLPFCGSTHRLDDPSHRASGQLEDRHRPPHLGISTEVAAVARAAHGLTVTDLAGGTPISAPDDWPADRVVAAMTETLAGNGLDEIPH